MAVTLPATGKADWTDYEDYWRELDAEWIQDRIVLRVTDDGQRDGLGQSPGGVVYNGAKDALEWRSSGGGYKTLTPVSANLVTTEVTGPPATTTISHKDASLKGVVFGAAEVGITNKLNVLGGTLVVEATGVSLKTGTKTAKLTTDAVNLVSDTPISAPGVIITSPGALSASGRAGTIGSLAVEGALTGGSISTTGVLSGGANSVIGGTTLKAGGLMDAPGGLQSSNGYFYGDGSSAVMRQRNSGGGAQGAAYFQVTAADTYVGGTLCFMNATLLIRLGKPIYYYDTANNYRANIAPSLYSSGDPGAGYFPDGTIWIS